MSKLTIDEEGFAAQMMEDVAFTVENLDKAYIEQASLFCYYAEQSRMASKKMDNFKLRIGTVEADLDRSIRNEAVTTGVKVTEKAIEQSIARDEKYVKCVMAYNDAKATNQLLRDILESFKQRSTMLVQLGSSQREALRSTGLRLNENAPDLLKARRDTVFG